MSEKLKIKLSIANRVYPLTIDSKQEEGLRKAAQKIDAMIKQFEQSYSTAYQYSFDERLDLLLRYLTLESAVDDGNNDDSTVCSS